MFFNTPALGSGSFIFCYLLLFHPRGEMDIYMKMIGKAAKLPFFHTLLFRPGEPG